MWVSPIRPVTGGIMASFLLLSLTAWGYRTCGAGERGLLDRQGDTTASACAGGCVDK